MSTVPWFGVRAFPKSASCYAETRQSRRILLVTSWWLLPWPWLTQTGSPGSHRPGLLVEHSLISLRESRHERVRSGGEGGDRPADHNWAASPYASLTS